jgi:hypothetical protein
MWIAHATASGGLPSNLPAARIWSRSNNLSLRCQKKALSAATAGLTVKLKLGRELHCQISGPRLGFRIRQRRTCRHGQKRSGVLSIARLKPLSHARARNNKDRPPPPQAPHKGPLQ